MTAPQAAHAVPVVVGLDVATAAVRVVCVDAAGRVVAEGGAALPQPVAVPGGGREQDARAWWPAAVRSLCEATARLPGRGGEVRAITVSATSGTFVLADRAGEPVCPASMYDDRRAAELNVESAHGPASCVHYPLRRDGERCPFVSGAARGFRLGAPRDDVERHRATLEGVAFLERLAVEHAAAVGIAVEPPLYTAGGGSRSMLWNRIRATVLGMPLRTVPRAETAFGAALIAASGTLHASLAEATDAMVEPGELVEPVPGEREALLDSYGRFTAELGARGWLGPDAG